MARPVTVNCYGSLMMDVWPGAAAICDFGLDTTDHYAALQGAIRNGCLAIEDLDAILGDGPAITAAVNAAGTNPKGLTFTTAYDFIPEGM